MKAFLIDPEKKEISAVEFDGHLLSLKELIHAETITAIDIYSSHPLPRNAKIPFPTNTIYIDDDALLHATPKHFFIIRGYPQPLAGKGLVVGMDAEGNDVEPTLTLGWLKENISWRRVNREITIRK